MKKNSTEEIISRLKKIDTMLILILIITVLIGTSAQAAEVNHTSAYSTCMVITEINYNEDIVVCETGSGFIYSFYGIEDLFINDIIICTMDDNGTPKNIKDDKIVDIKYSGFSLGESPN